MLASAVALGVTAGSLNAPSVTAAREPAVLGFVPEPGWFAIERVNRELELPGVRWAERLGQGRTLEP